MAELVVYGVPGSPYLRSVLLGFEEKQVPYRLARMGLGDGKSPEHLARNPFGRIPVIEHDGFSLYETQAILRYIDAAFPGVALEPADIREAARMNQLIGIVDCYFFRDVSATISFNRIIAPTLGLPTNEETVASAIPKAEICAGAVAGLVGDNQFLAGGALSIADLMLVPHLEFFAMTPEGKTILAPHPRLLEWLERMQGRDSMRTTSWQALSQAA